MQSFIRQTVPTVTTRHHWPSSGVFGVSWRVSNPFPACFRNKRTQNGHESLPQGDEKSHSSFPSVSGSLRNTAIR
jgi:hypothetical protein